MHKKLIVTMLCVALGMLLFATSASAIAPGYTGETPATAGIGINGSVHDLRRANTRVGYKSSPADSLDRLCIFCHAPHHTYKLTTAGAIGTGPIAPANATYLPLWNHTITTMVFIPYKNGPDEPINGPKRSQAIDTFDKIGATSLLCLSCHDGSISVNEYGHAPQNPASQSSGGLTIDTEYNIGKDGYLANHHPIGFPYDVVAGLDPEIYQSNIAVFDQTYDGKTDIIPVANLLPGGKMECSTCHAVHNKGNSGEKLLYVSDKNSNLCFSCHNKGSKTAAVAP
jgi:predicted CXXCH cytochrome family protein